MRSFLVVTVTALVLTGSPHDAHALAGMPATRGARVANSARREGRARAIPAWARKYNMNCSGCHYPTVPRLNATGLTFKWAGYRMPSEIGKNLEVKRIEEYLAARVLMQYVYTKTAQQSADSNALVLPEASLFAGGGLGRNYGTFIQFERTPDGAVDLIGQIAGVWGREDGFGGVRLGQGHAIVGGAAAGFDRPTGTLGPLALEEPTTAAIPFRFAGDVAGIEAFYVLRGVNRTSVQFVNGLAPGGQGMETATSQTRHDWVVTNQLELDDYGAALTAVGYFGSIAGLDSARPGLVSRYTRLGISANKFIGPFEAQAGYVHSIDRRLPTGGALAFTSTSLSGDAYWFYGGYTARPSYWTVYGRYELLDPDRAVRDAGLRRVVFGSVLPVNVPEYLRLGLEYFRDMPRAADVLNRQGARAEVSIAF